MQKTLLDFITGCVNKREARKFYQALGGPGESSQLIKKIGQYYSGNPSFRGFFDNLANRLFGEKKAPFDLSAEEVGRLSQVLRDREFEVTLDVDLTPTLWSVENTPAGQVPQPQEIAYKVKDFYLENKMHFESPKDIRYDSQKNKLWFRGPRRMAEKLLRKFDIPPQNIKQILKNQAATRPRGPGGVIDIPLSDFMDIAAEEKLTQQHLKNFEGYAKKYLHAGEKIKVEVNKPDITGSIIKFTGSLPTLEAILRGMVGKNAAMFGPLVPTNVMQIEQLIKKLE